MLKRVSPASAHQSSLQTSLKRRMQLWEVILLPGFVSFSSFTAHLRRCCNEQAKKQNRDSHLTPAALGGHQEHWGPGRTFHSLSSWPEENGPYLPLFDLTKGETNPEEVLLPSYRTRWDEWLIIHWNLKRMVSVRSEWIKERNTKQKGHVSFIRKLKMGCFVQLLRIRASVSTHEFWMKRNQAWMLKIPRGCLQRKGPLEPRHPGSCMWLEKPVDSKEPINTFFHHISSIPRKLPCVFQNSLLLQVWLPN